ncbi:hypothetical protein [Photobacterium sp. TY1-4]|uniref:hypothetical protein n=1 Tax=Photobacterium sp. TY1-4 TaxID=2899122 RepID=UPI0021BE7330|nr:hypothetical protein [Photobacterium sp. TY1-4]UXH99912.1 hypothetical protein NH461_08680 [Photobacterium sp. TY1-4]
MKEMKCEILAGVAHLEAVYISDAQNETPVFFYKGSPEHWSLTYWQVRQIWAERNFSAKEKSNKPDRGLFRIGPMYNWYYSHSLFNTPQDLEKQIQDMLQFALIGEVKANVNETTFAEEATA